MDIGYEGASRLTRLNSLPLARSYASMRCQPVVDALTLSNPSESQTRRSSRKRGAMRRASLDDEAEEQHESGAALASIAATRSRLRRGEEAVAAAAAGDEDESDAAEGGMARLLAEQRAFLSSQQAPAARVVRHGDAAPAAAGAEGTYVSISSIGGLALCIVSWSRRIRPSRSHACGP